MARAHKRMTSTTGAGEEEAHCQDQGIRPQQTVSVSERQPRDLWMWEGSIESFSSSSTVSYLKDKCWLTKDILSIVCDSLTL